MNFTDLQNPEVQDWIHDNVNQNVYELALKKSPFAGIEMKDLVQQIQGLQTAKTKFPILYQKGILFPPKLNLEQTSSQATALYKANLLQGETMADITGGFGIDAMAFAKVYKKVFHIERNLDLQKHAENNFKTLEIQNIESFATDGIDFLLNFHEKLDVIYIDPSRRNLQKKKVFLLEDLQPNLLEVVNLIKEKANYSIIKLSPLIDLTYLIEILEDIAEIHVVALKNEVKEVLIVLNFDSIQKKTIKAVNLETNHADFAFDFFESKNAEIQYSELKKYIYEPNGAIQKSGGNDTLGNQFNLKKLHPNTQLFTSENLNLAFPGRIFEVLDSIKNPKQELKGKSIQAVHRNFSENLFTIQKKFKLNLNGTEPVLFAQSLERNYINYLKMVKL